MKRITMDYCEPRNFYGLATVYSHVSQAFRDLKNRSVRSRTTTVEDTVTTPKLSLDNVELEVQIYRYKGIL